MAEDTVAEVVDSIAVVWREVSIAVAMCEDTIYYLIRNFGVVAFAFDAVFSIGRSCIAQLQIVIAVRPCLYPSEVVCVVQGRIVTGLLAGCWDA